MARYVMKFDPLTGEGGGSYVKDDGSFGCNVLVKMRRGERLKVLPRIVE